MAMLGGGAFRQVNIQQVMGDLQKSNVSTGTVNDIQTHITQQDAQINQLQSQLNDCQKQVANLTATNTDLTQKLTAADAQIAQLQSQLAQATATQPQQITPDVLASSFKSVMDKIQEAARSGVGTQATLSKMDIQMKTLITVQPNTSQPVLVLPDPKALPDPNHLSTLTLSFGAIPSLRAPAPAAGPPSVAGQAPAAPSGPSPAPAAVPSHPAGAGSARPSAVRSVIQPLLDVLRVLGTRRRP